MPHKLNTFLLFPGLRPLYIIFDIENLGETIMVNKIKFGLILITLLLCSCLSSEITADQKVSAFVDLPITD
jgi:hypothetical protein